MNKETMEALMSSDVQDWCTPLNVVALIKSVRKIDLDPCSNPNSIVKAQNNLCKTTPSALSQVPLFIYDGLTSDWSQFINKEDPGIVFINPPYKDIKKWMQKIVYEYHNGVECIALVPARVDTKWWHASVKEDQMTCFWKGRIKFIGGKYSAPFPSALIYFGKKYRNQFREVFKSFGLLTSVINNCPLPYSLTASGSVGISYPPQSPAIIPSVFGFNEANKQWTDITYSNKPELQPITKTIIKTI